MLVHRLLADAASHAPDAVALIEPHRKTTYGQLDQLADRCAALLQGAGVRRGDRVLVALENCAELVAMYFGTMKAGAVAVPLPVGPKSDRLARVVRDCEPTVAVVDAAAGREIGATHPLGAVPVVFVLDGPTGAGSPSAAVPATAQVRSLAQALDMCPEQPAPVRSIDSDLAAIIYTSGSTGEPRGVMLTHRNIVSNTRSIVEYLALTARDSVMCVLPFYYVYGLSLLHTHVAVGGTVVIDNRFAFPNVVLRAMQEHAVTGLAGVPSTFALLLHRSALGDIELPSLRYVTQAGGNMPTARIVEWRERGPAVPLYVMYGATEASARLTYLDPARLTDKPGSIGKPIPNVEIVILTDDGRSAAPYEIGELIARGSNISRGYWNDPKETEEKFGPLGYRTGDLGYADNEGFLFLVGRRHDMLKVGAHRVGAKEIEDIVHEFPGVIEATVVGAPHDLLGEVPVAFVALREGSDAQIEALKAFCRSRLPAHKLPAQFIIVKELPKLGGVGKIDRARLREQAGAAGVGARS